MKTFVASNSGKQRERNEDSYLLDEKQKLFVVCDGMGGHKGGDVASKLAVDMIGDFFREGTYPQDPKERARFFLKAVWAANHKILQQARHNRDLAEMGTTLTAVCIGADNLMTAAHVGDSSLYLYRTPVLKRVTKEHTMAEKMVAEGEIARDDTKLNAYKHILTRAVGIEKRIKVDIVQKILLPGDILLICSDGLTDLVSDQTIQMVLAEQTSLSVKGERMINEALQLGGHDNVTVLLIAIE